MVGILGHNAPNYLLGWYFLGDGISILGTLFYTFLECKRFYRIDPCTTLTVTILLSSLYHWSHSVGRLSIVVGDIERVNFLWNYLFSTIALKFFSVWEHGSIQWSIIQLVLFVSVFCYYPPASEASKEVANLNKRKNTHIPYMSRISWNLIGGNGSHWNRTTSVPKSVPRGCCG